MVLELLTKLDESGATGGEGQVAGADSTHETRAQLVERTSRNLAVLKLWYENFVAKLNVLIKDDARPADEVRANVLSWAKEFVEGIASDDFDKLEKWYLTDGMGSFHRWGPYYFPYQITQLIGWIIVYRRTVPFESEV